MKQEWKTIGFRATESYQKYLEELARKENRTLAGFVKNVISLKFPDPKKEKK